MLGIQNKITRMFYYKYVFAIVLTCTYCTSQHNTPLIPIRELPNTLKEISGICVLSDHFLYAINDSGNSNTLFRLTPEGDIIKRFTIPNTQNKDWEDLTSDSQGNIYIGDFGNNDNDRKDLVIYKVSGIATNTPKATPISFFFEDQKKFPPKRKHRNFDVEAFIYDKDYFYLFTKDRSKPYTGVTKVYAVPALSGTHPARHISSLSICNDKNSCSITSAVLSPKGNQIILLTHNQIILLKNFNPNLMDDITLHSIPLHHFSQKEGICFKNENTLYITEEGNGKQHSFLYEFEFTP